MRIEVQDDYRIAVELTKDDMSELDITYDDLDYSNIETRRVLWTVLDEASHTIGRDINLSERMLIEAIPALSGGCIIYFTVLPSSQSGGKGTKILKKEGEALICDISRIENVFSLAGTLKKHGYNQKSELYAKDGRYRLILYPEMGDELMIENILCEYGDILGKNKAYILSRMKEHWNRLCSPDAIDKLGLGN